MRISDLVKLSTDNLRRRKGRTALTVIGVVVGTCAIVVMISLGIAMNKQTDEMLQSYGDLTQVQINNYGSSPDVPALDEAMLNQIKANEHVLAATPYSQSWDFYGKCVAGKKERYETDAWNMYGVDMTAMEPMGFTLKSGTWIDSGNSYGKNKIPVLVGENFAYTFCDTKRKPENPKYRRYPGQTDAAGNELPAFVDPEKDKLNLVYYDSEGKEAGRFELVVVGVLTTDYSKGYFTEGGFVMSLENLEKVNAAYRKANKITSSGPSQNGYQEVYVKVDSLENVEEVETFLKDLGYPDIYSMQQQREEMQASVAKSQMILGGLAAISLLVAALNIMNTMTMAIYERTREIGVMKVLGCELWQIHAMFLIESGFIGFIGGLVGVAVSLGISFLLNHLTMIMAFFGQTVDMSWLNQLMGTWVAGEGGEISIVPMWLILAALAFATLVGLLSGIAPAGRAVKISALEAIRHD